MRDSEKDVFEAARQQLAAFSDRLRVRGITWTGPEHELLESEDSKYTSEFRITFWRNDDLLDVFEDLIYHEGKLRINTEIANEWFRSELDAFIQKFDSNGL